MPLHVPDYVLRTFIYTVALEPHPAGELNTII